MRGSVSGRQAPDYLIDEVLLIEHKTLPDLVASIKDGRLFR